MVNLTVASVLLQFKDLRSKQQLHNDQIVSNLCNSIHFPCWVVTIRTSWHLDQKTTMTVDNKSLPASRVIQDIPPSDRSSMHNCVFAQKILESCFSAFNIGEPFFHWASSSVHIEARLFECQSLAMRRSFYVNSNQFSRRRVVTQHMSSLSHCTISAGIWRGCYSRLGVPQYNQQSRNSLTVQKPLRPPSVSSWSFSTPLDGKSKPLLH